MKIEKKFNDKLKYSPEEIEYKNKLIEDLLSAKTQRNNKWTEFDDDNYLTVYEDNAKAANSYLRPKDNNEDTRIVTGTTKQKVQTLLSTTLNLNLEPNIIAFDKDNIIIDQIGEQMEDMVKKSREIEDYESKRPLIYKEGFDQGTAFVEELFVSRNTINKEIKELDWSEGIKVNKIKWDEKLKKINGECQCNLLDSTKVYLGNIREFSIDKQPYVFTIDHIPYSEVKSIFKTWERFDYVSKDIEKVIEAQDDIPYSDWSLLELKNNMVEVIKYQNKWTNEYQIILNGVMMLPVGFPLTAISPSGEYSIVKLDINPVSKFFAYSKSVPSDTKILQEVYDEFLRLMILKTEQSYTPAMVNNTNRILSKRNLLPGVITRDVNTDQFKPVIVPTGVTQSEFNMVTMIRDIINDNSLDPSFTGQDTGNITATEYSGRFQQQMKKLGYSLLGVINFEKKLAWLRVQNIIANWTKPIDTKVDDVKNKIVEVYRAFEMDTEDQGKPVRKIIEFSPEGSQLDDYQVMAEEKMIEQGRFGGQKEVRKVYINPEMLRNLKYNWFITINPTEKDNDQLNRVLLVQNIQDAMVMFPGNVNMEYLKQRFASVIGEDPEKFFLKQQQMAQGMPPQGQEMLQAGPGGQVASQVAQGVQKPQQPSINTLER